MERSGENGGKIFTAGGGGESVEVGTVDEGLGLADGAKEIPPGIDDFKIGKCKSCGRGFLCGFGAKETEIELKSQNESELKNQKVNLESQSAYKNSKLESDKASKSYLESELEFDIEKEFGKVETIGQSAKVKLSSSEIYSCQSVSSPGSGRSLRSGVVDSGATHVCSGSASDFKSFTSQRMWLTFANGERVLPLAKVGNLKSNNFGLSKALFHRSVTGLLISVQALKKAGHSVLLSPRRDRIVLNNGGGAIPLLRIGGLPSVVVELCEESNGSEAVVSAVKASRQKQLEHERRAHVYVRGGVTLDQCEQCIMGKGTRKSHKSERHPDFKPKKALERVAFDFVGPFPRSLSGNTQLLNGKDDFDGFGFSRPCKSKNECGEALGDFLRLVGQPERVRTDNAQEFKGLNGPWRRACAKPSPRIANEYSQPYEPQGNGRVERFNRFVVETVRTLLVGVDPRVWDYAARFATYHYNRVPHGKSTISPFEIRRGAAPKSGHFRRFGCLCYALDRRQKLKTAPKWEKGIFLGFAPENSCFLVGLWGNGKL